MKARNVRPVWTSASANVGVSEKTLARPKSRTFMRSPSRNRLAGLTSRWDTFSSWATASAEATGARSLIASVRLLGGAFSARRRRRSCSSVSPSSHSMTMYGVQGPFGAAAAPMSSAWTMPMVRRESWWSRRASSRNLARKASCWSGPRPVGILRHLTATGASKPRCRAR
ncbi:hypothetical protein BE20_30680 [Sorangium cellulosum]|nr:hypothetical protein BE20_30680 [Sorangium cellulosum]